ncbi:MAG: hypothetical protein NWQ17_03830 [Polaribacter sp.]|nr:hypothetical protein [Polaribacter sp.]
MQNSKSIIFKLNVPTDSFVDLNFFNDNFLFEEQNFFFISEFPKSKTDSLILFVDSQNDKFHSEFHSDIFHLPPPPKEIQDEFDVDEDGDFQIEYDTINKDSIKKHYKMYPIYIKNYSSKNIEIEKPIAGGDFFMILEAKNLENQWKPVEYFEQFGFLCGTGHQNYLIKPNNFFVGGIIKYEGEFLTDLRVKFRSFDKVFYSNTFKGKINQSQFKNDSIIKNTKDKFRYKGEKSLQLKLKNMFLN